MILLILAQLHLYTSDKQMTVDYSPLCEASKQAQFYRPKENMICVDSSRVIHKQLIFRDDFEVKK